MKFQKNKLSEQHSIQCLVRNHVFGNRGCSVERYSTLFFSEASQRSGILTPWIWLAHEARSSGPDFPSGPRAQKNVGFYLGPEATRQGLPCGSFCSCRGYKAARALGTRTKIVWLLHHYLNTLLLAFCEVVSVLEFNVFVHFDEKFALVLGFLVLSSCLRPEWRLQIASCFFLKWNFSLTNRWNNRPGNSPKTASISEFL